MSHATHAAGSVSVHTTGHAAMHTAMGVRGMVHTAGTAAVHSSGAMTAHTTGTAMMSSRTRHNSFLRFLLL